VDPHESSRSYVFGPSTITIGHIRQLAALGYFAVGSACEPKEEIIPELTEDEAVVSEEFFTGGVRMKLSSAAAPAGPKHFCSVV
jgi:hypothetical protein